MRYDNADLRSALSAEYVLGTLRGPARRRFERLMRERAEWRAEAERWSARLSGLAAGVRPEAPPPAVWQKIVSRIDPARAVSRRLRWGQAIAALATVAALAFGIALFTGEPAQPPQVAILKDAESRAGYLIRVTRRSATDTELRMIVESGSAPPGTVHELWAIPAAGKPVHVALLPAAGEQTIVVSAEASRAVRSAAALAVSVEPPGGSPTGQPTGPVTHQGKLTPL